MFLFVGTNRNRGHFVSLSVYRGNKNTSTWRTDLGYPAQPGLIGESVHPIRLRLCTNIVIYGTAPQTQTRCHIHHSIIIV
jgi:hypothetical protein